MNERGSLEFLLMTRNILHSIYSESPAEKKSVPYVDRRAGMYDQRCGTNEIRVDNTLLY